MFLRVPGILLKSWTDVRGVTLIEASKGHIKGCGRFDDLLVLPGHSLSPRRKSSLLGLFPLAGIIRIAVDHPPCTGLTVSVNRHLLLLSVFVLIVDFPHGQFPIDLARHRQITLGL